MAKALRKKNDTALSAEDLSLLIRPAFTDMNLLSELDEGEKKDALSFKVFPIDILIKADWNYKEDDDYTGEKLRNNLKRNGQVENVQVRLLKTGYYEVINGNHRLNELNALGKKFVICYDHGKITDSEAQRIAIETNETRFKSNRDKLTELVLQVVEDFGYEEIFDTMPFTEDEMNAFMNGEDPESDRDEREPKTSNTFYINIECEDEKHASELYERFLQEGLKTKIIS